MGVLCRKAGRIKGTESAYGNADKKGRLDACPIEKRGGKILRNDSDQSENEKKRRKKRSKNWHPKKMKKGCLIFFNREKKSQVKGPNIKIGRGGEKKGSYGGGGVVDRMRKRLEKANELKFKGKKDGRGGMSEEIGFHKGRNLGKA